jgi:hypothetical protein
MVGNLLSKASSAVSTCARRVSRATHHLLRPRPSHRRDRREPLPTDVDHHQQEELPRADEVEAAEDALWRRAILIGEWCKPLDFPGVIHYNSFGRQLSAAPPLHSCGTAALLCRSMNDVDEAAVVAPRMAMAKRA